MVRRPQINPSIPFLVGVGLMGAAASLLILGQIENERHPDRTTWYALAIGLLVAGAGAVFVGVLVGVGQWRRGERRHWR
jgi:hypothetical protein